MYGVVGSPGKALGSVALRYRQPTARRPWPANMAGSSRGWSAEPEPEEPVRKGPTTRSEPMARLEAVLFLAREPLGSRKLADLAGLADGTLARTLVRKLNRIYDLEGCAFRVSEIAGGFQLMSRVKFAPWLRRLYSSPVEVRLSTPAMETLAVVAYRQPVLRVEIEAVRGVQCGEILRQLMERDLVRIVGRSEDLGRPFLYGTTKQFLQVFGLRRLDELPRAGLPSLGGPELTGQQPADSMQSASESDITDQPVNSSKTGGESNVMTADTIVVLDDTVPEDAVGPDAATVVPDERDEGSNGDEYAYDDSGDEDEDDYDDLEDDDEVDDEDLEEDEWEEIDDDEDTEWEEIEDDDEEEESEDDDWEEDDDWGDEEDEVGEEGKE